MPIVVHLIPYDGIGGVERAASSMRAISSEGIEFNVKTIFPPSASNSRWVVWNPWYFLRTALNLWRTNPSVLIVSLWRAYAVGILMKLLRPKILLVVFLHLPHDVHVPDRLLTRLAARLARRVWADSHETLLKRLPHLVAGKGQVISFVTARITALPAVNVRPTFVFWGRLHAQKGLTRALRIFASVLAQQSSAQFWIVGPDGGDLGCVRAEVSSLGIGDAVQFFGPKEFSVICDIARDASFYLQTSELEGMAMSVVEAMQLGLVPVVTPVGEIAHYARHGDNAVVVTDDANAVADVLALLDNDLLYRAIRQRAAATWSDRPLYKDSVFAACREVLSSDITKSGKK